MKKLSAGSNSADSLACPKKADLYGASKDSLADPSDAKTSREEVLSAGPYDAVHSIRQGLKVNPSLRGGIATEKANVGSFDIKGDDRINLCHTRFLVEKKQNITFSFDPLTLKCYNCKNGGHDV